jgi:hypothetical protein
MWRTVLEPGRFLSGPLWGESVVDMFPEVRGNV